MEEYVEYSHPTVFKGTYEHRIDGKGRLPVPAAFRRGLTSQGSSALVVTLFDQCLAAYPPESWARLESELAALPAFSRQVKAVTRLLASRAADCEIDVQGRILLPPALHRAAGLEREAVVIGVLNRFEIWAPDSWATFVRESESLLDDVSTHLNWPTPAAPVGPPAGTLLHPPRPQGKPSR